MKKFILLLSLFLAGGSAFSQNINGRFSSSIYTFERFDTINVSNTYIRSFQLLSLNVNEGKFSLRTQMNLENDLSKNIKNDPRLRFYNLYFEARNIADIATIKLGRQPIFNNVAGGLMDGINLDLKYDNYKLTGYYGGNVPGYQKLEITENWEDNYILGGKFTARFLDDFQVTAGYVNKNFKPQDYFATRYDENLNPIQVLIQNNSAKYEFLTGEVQYEMKNIFSVNTRYDYDLGLDKSSRFEIFGTYDELKKIKFNAYYNYREPRVKYNSIFSVFDYGNTQEIEIGADYILNKLITVIGKFGNVEYKGDNSQRITAGVNTNFGSLIYRKNLGYAGEMDAISVYSAYSFLEGLITPSLGVSFTNYKLSEDAETNNLTTILAGLNYRPYRIFSVDLQGQFMNNKIYSNDFRLFLKLNYWFNTNLNLL